MDLDRGDLERAMMLARFIKDIREYTEFRALHDVAMTELREINEAAMEELALQEKEPTTIEPHDGDGNDVPVVQTVVNPAQTNVRPPVIPDNPVIQNQVTEPLPGEPVHPSGQPVPPAAEGELPLGAAGVRGPTYDPTVAPTRYPTEPQPVTPIDPATDTRVTQSPRVVGPLPGTEGTSAPPAGPPTTTNNQATPPTDNVEDVNRRV